MASYPRTVKLAIVGSGALADDPQIQATIEREIRYHNPAVILLAPNRKLNTFVKAVAAKLGIYVNEMRPPKPSWLGPAKTSLRKRHCRELQAHFIVSQANWIICISKIGAPGVNYRRIVEKGKEAGTYVFEMGF